MNTDDIRFILENALRAPSGDNTQPWHWFVHGYSFELWNASSNEQSQTLYSSNLDNNQASCVAFGAAIENVVIAATVRKYHTTVSYFPDPARPMLVAVLTLSEDSTIVPDSLSATLSKRVTNRKAYQRKPLQADVRTKLINAGTDEEVGETKLIDDKESVDILAGIASLHDEFMFGIKDLHTYFFSHISWTKREDARRRIGFYFPTLAAPPCTRRIMQLMQHWWFMRIGIIFGLHKFAAFEQRISYRRSGAYGVVVTRHGNTPIEWVKAGRLVERLWLTATADGLSLHPLNGTLLLAQSLDTKEGQQVFSSEQQQRLKEGREQVVRLFGAENKTIIFMFRIGYGKPPAARTSRLPFEKMVTLVS